MTRRPVLAALAVLVEDGHVLLVRRMNEPDAGLWGYPGGKVEWGEPIADAAVRELAEETGVEGEAAGFLTLIDVIGGSAADRHHYALAAVLCRRLSGSPAAADDVSDAAWHPLDAVLDRGLPMSAHVDAVARLALARLAAGGPLPTVQSGSPLT